MLDHFATRAKSYAALIGAVLTAVIGTGTDNKWLTLAAAVCTAVATYAVPNADEATPRGEDGCADGVVILLVAILLGVVLLLFGVRFGR